MSDLLTTHDVQERLHVDRTTIYRMVEAGELPALRVGKQWRFPAADFERWLRAHQTGAAGAAATPLATPVALPKPQAPAAEPRQASKGEGLGDVLPLPCAQLIQDVFAEVLDVMLVVTDMQGRCITQVSNPCGFFVAAHANAAAGTMCTDTYRRLAATISLEPRFVPSELGLLCARGLIRNGSELKGILVAGGIAPDGWPPSADQVATLADTLGLDPALLGAKVDEVHRLDKAGREQVLRSIQRIADVFSHIAEDRGVLYGRLRSIAALASV